MVQCGRMKLMSSTNFTLMWLWFVEIKHFNCLKLVTWPVTAIHSVLHQGSIATLPTLKFVYDIMPPGLIFEQKYWTNKSQFGTPLRDLYHTFAFLCWKFFPPFRDSFYIKEWLQTYNDLKVSVWWPSHILTCNLIMR